LQHFLPTGRVRVGGVIWGKELRSYRVALENRTVSSSDSEAILDAEPKSGGAIECHRTD
jgi:hypothetical protein